MNYKKLKAEYNIMVNQAAAPQLNKGMLIDIMHYLESQHKATDKRTTEYMDGKDDNIKELNKALSVAYEDNDMLKSELSLQQSIKRRIEKENQDLVEANKMLRRSNEELVKDIKVLEDERDVLQRAVDIVNARNKKTEEINKMIQKKDAILILSDNFSFSE